MDDLVTELGLENWLGLKCMDGGYRGHTQWKTKAPKQDEVKEQGPVYGLMQFEGRARTAQLNLESKTRGK